MWIRTQDKTELTNVAQVDRFNICWDITNTNVLIYTKNTTLGVYSTKENALKVLDMIQEIIADNVYMEVGSPRTFLQQHCVFKMPKDSEVE